MLTVENILKVNQAGEYGAIHIYKAQLWLAKYFYPDIVPSLKEVLGHEQKHYTVFTELLRQNSLNSCSALKLWSLGGFCLGFITALVGRNAIWVCTDAVETVVLEHFEDQLGFVEKCNPELYHALVLIKAEELQHQELGKNKSQPSVLYKLIYLVVAKATKVAIWLSTKF